MMQKAYIVSAMLVLLMLLSVSTDAGAFICREYKLDEVIKACSNVIFGKVNLIDQKKMSFAIEKIENIRGEGQFKKIQVSLSTGRADYPKQLMDKLRADAPVVVFYIPIGNDRFEALGYASDVWIRLFAVRNRQGNFRWYYTHIEKYMSQTFSGDVLKLQSQIREICPGKEKFTPVDIDEFIRRRYTLKEIVDICTNVVTGSINSVDERKMCIAINKIENIKGKDQAKQIKLNLATGQPDAVKQLMSKFHDDVLIAIFYVPINGKRVEALGYVAETWIRLFAVPDSSKAFDWYFGCTENYMKHIFDGDALTLKSLVQEMVTEKKTAYAQNKTKIVDQGE